MTDLWQFIGLVGATVIYAVMLVAALHSPGIYPFVPVFARLKKRHAEDVLLVIFVFGAICAGGSKGTNGNNRASHDVSTVLRQPESGLVLRDGAKRDATQTSEELRFTSFAVDTNAVHFAVSLPSGASLPESKLDLFATHDVDTNIWEFIGCYDIAVNDTNLVDSVALYIFPFPVMDRLFLTLGSRADLDGDGAYDAREKFMYGTSPALSDTDGDGLLDGYELAQVPALDPLSADTDHDGYMDGEEMMSGTSPYLYNNGAGAAIRYYYDDDDRLVGAYSGHDQASSSTSFTPAGNPLRQVAR